MDAEHGLEAERLIERRHHDPLLEVLVGEVGARERGELGVQAVGLGPLRGALGADGLVGHVLQAVHPCLEADVVALDLLGEVGQVLLDRRLHVRVLVLGVRHQQLDDGVDVVGDLDPAGAEGGIDVAGLHGHGEELAADRLVDVPVQVDGDELQGRGGGAGLAGGVMTMLIWGSFGSLRLMSSSSGDPQVCAPKRPVSEC